MKNLPKLYKQDITKEFNNNKKVCYITEEKNNNDERISLIINSIFHGKNMSDNIPVSIKTNEKQYNTILVAKDKTKIYTLENEAILIKDIIEIEKIDH